MAIHPLHSKCNGYTAAPRSSAATSHLGQLREVVREGFHAAGGLAPVEVFVRRVVAVLGETET